MDDYNIVAEWLRYAKRDMDAARHLFDTMNPKPLEIVCYHAQQAVEKALKAFLLSCDTQPPKTHDLNQLCELCEDREKSFFEIAPLCGSLTKYGISPRYPFELEIFEDETEIALQRAEKIKAFVASKIPGRIV